MSDPGTISGAIGGALASLDRLETWENFGRTLMARAPEMIGTLAFLLAIYAVSERVKILIEKRHPNATTEENDQRVGNIMFCLLLFGVPAIWLTGIWLYSLIA